MDLLKLEIEKCEDITDLKSILKKINSEITGVQQILQYKADKTELDAKATFADINRVAAEFKQCISSQMQPQENQHLEEQHITQQLQETYLNKQEFYDNIDQITTKLKFIDKIKQDLQHINSNINKDNNQSQLIQQIQKIKQKLQSKCDILQVQDLLKEKASKQSVSQSLRYKLDKADLESLLTRKADKNDLESVILLMEQKADLSSVQKVQEMLATKITLQEAEKTFEKGIQNQQEFLENVDARLNYWESQKESWNLMVKESLQHAQEELHNEILKIKRQLSKQIQLKLNKESLTQLQDEIKQRVDFSHFQVALNAIKQEIQSKIDQEASGLWNQFKDFQNVYRKEIGQITKKEKQQQLLYEKHQAQQEQAVLDYYQQSEQNLQKLVSEFEEQLNEIKAQINQIQCNNKQIITNQMKDIKGSIAKYQEQITKSFSVKLTAQEHHQFKAQITQALQDTTEDLKNQLIQKIQQIDNEIQNSLEKKISAVECQNIIRNKIQNFQKHIKHPITADQVLQITDQLKKHSKQIEQKVSIMELETNIQSLIQKVQEIDQTLYQKCNAKEMLQLLDEKCNIDEINSSIQQITQELEYKVNQQELNDQVQDQLLINEILSLENTVGRWIWKSGNLKNGHAIPWEVQQINTSPDTFSWTQGNSGIVVNASGLYMIQVGVFCKKRPVLQILVNGHPSIVVGGGDRRWIHHPLGNITGATYQDFLQIPSKVRITLAYSGESKGEGFLSLKRL